MLKHTSQFPFSAGACFEGQCLPERQNRAAKIGKDNVPDARSAKTKAEFCRSQTQNDKEDCRSSVRTAPFGKMF